MASDYNSAQAFKVARHFEYKNGMNIETISADKDLTYKDAQHQIITNDKGSSATIKVPAKRNGAYFWFKNDAASGHPFVIQDADGNPIIGGGGLAAGKAACVVCDGSSWAVLFQQA
jgi:hypothetical protein|tara:strand:+ start:450 stop:797 length:348 start_codon:yes stop_codon:yes gene_type:complete